MTTTPTWRELYNTWEKAVAPGLEELTGSPGFQDLLAVATKANASIATETERLSRRWLHAWNLPAASDMRLLRRQVASLEREVTALRRSVERSRPPTSATAPMKKAAPKKAAAKKNGAKATSNGAAKATAS